jgi:hypothetical protein
MDHVLLTIEDLIQVEPERAESLEIARLELLKLRENLADEHRMAVLAETPVKSVLKIIRLGRRCRARNRGQ